MNAFDLEAPGSLRAAVDRLDPEDPSVRVIAGGTALMLLMKAGVFRPSRLISLRAIEKRFSSMARSPDGSLRIGAMTTLSELEQSKELKKFAPVIAQTLHTLSNVRVRNVATIGGHLAHADPHMDLPPVLIALGAHVVVTGRHGERSLPVEDLYAGYYETVLTRDELISEIVIPAQQKRRSTYAKISTRSAHDWPAVGVAVSLDVTANVAREARVVISAATERPVRALAAEAALDGRLLDPVNLVRAAAAAADTIETVGDARGSAAYKRELVRVHVARALRTALADPGGNSRQ
jgi:carbon-monoxide dehydrogenase medium subunit